MKEKIKNHPVVFGMLLYTLLFTVIYIIVEGDNTYMYAAESDTELQYMPQIIGMKEFYTNLLNGSFSAMDLNTLFGTEQFFSLGYIFNPFNVILIFMPESALVYYFKIYLTLALYVSGIGFVVMCGNMNIKHSVAALAAVMYIFSPYAFYMSLAYYTFAAPLACFPFVITGMERILQGKSGRFLAAACFISVMFSGVYLFAYQIILTVIYAFVRVIFMGKAQGFFKRLWNYGFRGGLAAITGFALASAAVFPPMFAMLLSNRTDSPIRENVIEQVFTGDFDGLWQTLCGSLESQSLGVALALPAIIFIVLKGAPAAHKLLLGLCILGIYYPVFSAAMCAFAYVEHRWAFGFALLAAYTAAYVIQNIHKADIPDRILAGGALIIYILCLDSMTAKLAIPFLIVYLLIINIPPVRRVADKFLNIIERKRKYILEAILFLALTMFSVALLVINGSMQDIISVIIAYAAAAICCLENRGIKLKYMLGIIPVIAFPVVMDKLYGSTVSMNGDLPYLERFDVLEQIRDNDMAAGDEIVRFEFCYPCDRYNTGLYNDLASTSAFLNMFTREFDRMLIHCQFDMRSHNSVSILHGFEHRLPFMSVLGVDYIHKMDYPPDMPFKSLSGVNQIPYTFESCKTYTAENLKNEVYKNMYSLPFGFTYEEQGSMSERESMNGADYGINLMYSAGLDEGDIIGEAASAVSFEVPCNITEEITKYDEIGDITYTAYTLTPEEPISDGEVYVTVSGIDVLDNTFGNITVKVNDGENIFADFGGKVMADVYKWFTSQDSYTICCSTEKGAVEKVELLMSCEFDEISMTFFPISEYKERFEKLSEYTMENTVLGYDEITGNVTVPESRILCLQLQYSNGWKAYDNGEPAELLPVNGFMTGMRLSPGEHEIRLVYHVPYFAAGCIMSAVTGIALICIHIIGKKRRKGKSDIQKASVSEILTDSDLEEDK